MKFFFLQLSFVKTYLGQFTHLTFLKTNYSIRAEKFFYLCFLACFDNFHFLQEMQRTDKYFKKELFQGFISEGQFLYSYGVFIHSCVCFLFHSCDHCLLTCIIYLSVFFAGSNLLLQRIMVKRGVPEDMTFVAFDSTTSLCTSSYVRICITLSFCIVVFLFREKKFSILLYSLTENAWQVREENWFATSSCGGTESYDSFS